MQALRRARAKWGAMKRHLWHRWSRWASDFHEAPDGEMRVVEYRSRHCRRRHCDWIEEDRPRCVSLSPVVVLGLIR